MKLFDKHAAMCAKDMVCVFMIILSLRDISYCLIGIIRKVDVGKAVHGIFMINGRFV